MTVNAHRTTVLPADRGSRQHLKIMQLLAAVDGDGTAPLVETIVATAGRLRRGMTAILVTPSTDATWIRPIASLRTRGIATVVVAIDAPAFDRVARTEREREGEILAADRPGRRRAASPAGPRPPPRAVGVRDEGPHRAARPGARGGTRRMKLDPERTLAPEEGWSSLVLVAADGRSRTAWSIDDAGWVLGRSEWTDFLPWAAVLGVAVGFIGAKTGWSRWVAHVIGATFAALIVPIIVGSVLPQPRADARDAVRRRPPMQRSRPGTT